MNLLDLKYDQFSVPVIDYPCTITLLSQEFKELCRNAYIIGPVLNINAQRCDPINQVRFKVINDASVELKTDKDGKIKDARMMFKTNTNRIIDTVFSLEQSFALRFIIPFLENNYLENDKISSHLKISMHRDFPLKLEYILKDGIKYQLYIAPKLD